MSLREDRVNLVVTINGDSARKELGGLDQQAFDLREKMKGLEKDSRDFNKAMSELEKANHIWTETDKQVTKLRTELGGLVKGTDAYKEKTRELQNAEKRFERVDEKVAQLTTHTQKLKNSNDEYIKTSDGLKSVTNRMDEIKGSLGIAGLTTRELNQELKKLSAVRSFLVPGTEAFNQNRDAIVGVKKRLFELNQEVKVGEGFWSRMKTQFMEFGTLAVGYLGLQALTNQFTSIIKKNADLEDSLADIRKTTGLTLEQVRELNKEFGKINTRTATAELRQMAVVGGQLGIAKEDILGFAKSVDIANVALSDEFTGGAAQVATELGLLRNVFKDIKTDKVDQDLLHIGNALNQLGAEGAATGPVVADFSNRIGGVGITLGLTSSQVLGLSATLQELNVNTERGGTAVTRILLKMTQNTETFAKVAGLPVKEFTHLVNTDLFEAFTKVVQGAKNGGEQATVLGKILDELNVDGAGASEVIAKLGSNLGLLDQRVQLAGTAIKSTDSITNEFNIKNETLGATVDKLGKKFYNLISSNFVTGFVKGAVEGTSSLIDKLAALPAWLDRNSTLILALSGSVLTYYGRVVASTVATIANTTATIANRIAYEVGFRILLAKEALTAAYATTVQVLTGQITLATAAQRLWNFVVSLNPFALVLGAVTALATGISLYMDNTREAIALEREKKELSSNLAKAIEEVHTSQQRINIAVENFNKLSPTEQKNLLEQIKLEKELALAKLQSLEADQKQLQTDASKPGLWDTLLNSAKARFTGGYFKFQALQNETAAENGAEAASQFTDKIKELKNEIDSLEGTGKKVAGILNAEADAMAITAESTNQWEEKLRLLKIALNNTVKDGEDYKRIQKEISDVQEKLNINTGQSAKEIKEQENAIKKANEELKKYLEQVQKISHEIEVSKLSKDEQELQQIRDRFKPLIDQAKAHNVSGDPHQAEYAAEQIKLETELEAELERMRESFRQRDILSQQDAEDKIYDATLSNDERAYNAEARKWEELILLADKHGIDVTKLRDAQNKALTALDKKYKSAEKEATEKALKEKQELYRKGAAAVVSITDDLYDLLGNKSTEFGLFLKSFGIFQNVVDTGIAISNAIASIGPNVPFPGNLIAIATIIGQITSLMKNAAGTIGSAKPPKLESGGAVVLDGPSHTQGGLKVVDPVSNTVVAEGEGRELYVFSKKFVSKNPALVNAIMDASNNNDGVIRNPFWMDDTPVGINFSRINRASRYQKFEDGGRIAEFNPLPNDPIKQKGRAIVNIDGDVNPQNGRAIVNDMEAQELKVLIKENTLFLKKLSEDGVDARMVNSKFDRDRKDWFNSKKNSLLK